MVDGLSSPENKANLALCLTLRSRLLPVALFTLVIVTFSAPMAFLIIRTRELQGQAQVLAQQVAQLLQKEMRNQSELWQYDTIKIIEHLRVYRRQDHVTRIEVTDRIGRPIELTATDVRALQTGAAKAEIWETAAIHFDHQQAGSVWVAMSLTHIRRRTLLLLSVFLMLGLLLSCSIYAIPMKSIKHAEQRIDNLISRLEQTQASLCTLNQTLEQQVVERSAQLSDAYLKLQHREQTLRELSNRNLAIQEAERRAIARELHDSAGQALTAIHIHLQLIEQYLEQPEKIQQIVADTITMTDQTLQEIRRAVMMLGPSVLDDFGLTIALQRACEDFSERTSIPIACKIEQDLPPIPTNMENACYRIVQEAFTNIARHAKAKRVQISLQCKANMLEIKITDDGCGFDCTAKLSHNQRGIRGICERIELLGGKISFQSNPQHGTAIDISLPLCTNAQI